MDTDPPVASLSLTHVHYVRLSFLHLVLCRNTRFPFSSVSNILNGHIRLMHLQDPTDPVSHLCAFLALVPQGLIVAYVVLSWSSREIEIILAFVGQLACEALNFTLKRIIREDRPRQIRGKGYGMPSSHAQFMAFFAVYIGLFVLVRHQPKPRKGSGLGRDGSRGFLSSFMPSQYLQQVLTALLVLTNAMMVAASRVYLNYHTPKQVVVGCVAGTAFALAWYSLTAGLRRSGLLDRALNLELAQLFRLRDLLLDEDLVESGYREYIVRKGSRTGASDMINKAK